jgi:hypothetical protein
MKTPLSLGISPSLEVVIPPIVDAGDRGTLSVGSIPSQHVSVLELPNQVEKKWMAYSSRLTRPRIVYCHKAFPVPPKGSCHYSSFWHVYQSCASSSACLKRYRVLQLWHWDSCLLLDEEVSCFCLLWTVVSEDAVISSPSPNSPSENGSGKPVSLFTATTLAFAIAGSSFTFTISTGVNTSWRLERICDVCKAREWRLWEPVATVSIELRRFISRNCFVSSSIDLPFMNK